MNKKEFIKALENELIKLEVQDITNILEYYDELIEDQIENGKSEKEVINGINIYDIIKEVKAHKKISDAVEKPTISNSMKALIAFLGILSFPMLIVVGSIFFALFITIFAIMFSFIIAFGVSFFAILISTIALIGAIIFNQIPFVTGIFILGINFVLIGIFAMLTKWSIQVSKLITVRLIDLINNKFRKRVGNNE